MKKLMLEPFGFEQSTKSPLRRQALHVELNDESYQWLDEATVDLPRQQPGAHSQMEEHLNTLDGPVCRTSICQNAKLPNQQATPGCPFLDLSQKPLSFPLESLEKHVEPDQG